MDEQELLKLKKNLEQVKEDIAKNQGVLDQMQSALKELGFEDVEAAEKEIKRLKVLIAEKEEELKEDMEQIEEQVQEWDD